MKWQHQMYKKILNNTKKTFFSIILIKIAKGNVQENITQHKKRFFAFFLIEIATANVKENITQHNKTFL